MVESNTAALLDLKKQAYRGRRAAIFLRSETWRDVDESFADKQMKIEAESVWCPGKEADPLKWAFISAYNSGRSYEIGQLAKMWDRWIRDGREAEQKLKELGIEL